MKEDQAPVSSRHVRHALYRAIPGVVVDKLEIVTEVSPKDRAVTTVQRPVVQYADQHLYDDAVQKALRNLPNADPGIVMTMGRTFTVEWAGVCRPI